MMHYVSVCLLFLLAFLKQHDVTTIYLIGDSRVADYTLGDDHAGKRYSVAGWGQEFPAFFDSYKWDTIRFIQTPDTSGITGIRDSSFTRHGELLRMKKQYPDIRLVTEPEVSARISRDIVYRKVEGIPLAGDIYYTEGHDERAPGVLVIHGGGWRSGDKAQLGGLAYQLASAGYACFAINYRLSTQALYPAAVHDVEAALQWMKTNADTLGIDPTKIAVLGFSAGGQLAALLGAKRGKSEVQAIVDIDGILAFIHPESGEGNDTRSKSAATHWFGYSKTERPDLWQEASALNYVSRTTPPTLFLNSSVDRMHAGRGDFIRVLDEFGIYHETRTFADAPHSFCLFEPWFTPMSVAIIDFLDMVFSVSVATSHTGK